MPQLTSRNIVNPTIQAVLKAKADLLAYAAVPVEVYRSVVPQLVGITPQARKG
jgi:hypothetical protein